MVASQLQSNHVKTTNTPHFHKDGWKIHVIIHHHIVALLAIVAERDDLHVLLPRLDLPVHHLLPHLHDALVLPLLELGLHVTPPHMPHVRVKHVIQTRRHAIHRIQECVVVLLKERVQVRKRGAVILHLTHSRLLHLVHHNVVPLTPREVSALCHTARAGLRETEHRHRQVREAATVVLQPLHARLDLVQLQRDGARHEGGGRRDGGNDLARDLLDRVAIDRSDAVTTR